ncbi:winged helix-turn-helix domain-containing protein [Sphingomicrobium astaxanthinifaciens]|uniref:winged helix-turn-helix domain-containing protein n=1 Tax=Sphingomicrobium astaxanthinifaciens TaxID=1227949 RepID=UPI001FCB70F5|nr:transcriptional regulator [Sphingomicrobium astaxanthinifaciens]MCJ7421018.1 transcriptional regulator [Sphingomicrobium astaxanthinifaciens]
MTSSDPYRFDRFLFDPVEARLEREGEPVALQPRGLDLLHAFLDRPGRLWSKEELFERVWPGVTVGDEALTQAVKEVRRALGDAASAPCFIETVPKRGYRFIAPVERLARPGTPTAAASASHAAAPAPARPVAAATAGGAVAGLLGGLAYGLVAASGNEAKLPIIIVMTTLTAGIAALGALGLGLGMTLVGRASGRGFFYSALGAALGGFVVGDLFHLFASGSFSLFLGTRHDQFTGGLEGAVLGAAIAIGAQAGGGVGGRWPRPAIGAALGGAVAGAALSLAGGKLMAASLAALARRFHGSLLDLGLFGRLAGDDGLGAPVQAAIAAGEGLLLGAAMVACIEWRRARRRPR